MNIYNSHPTGLFIPYAGSSKRGVQVNPGQMGPVIPLSRFTDVPRMRNDLTTNRIKLVVSAEERALLLQNPKVDPAWLLDAATLTPKETVATATTAVAGVDVNLTADEKAAATSTAAIAPAIVVPPPTPAPKFNAIAAQLISELKSMKGIARHNKLKQLRNTADAGILAALPQVEAFFAKDKDATPPAVVVVEPTPAAIEPDPVVTAPVADAYTAMDRVTLLSECIKKGLPIEPTTPDAELRGLLRGAK